MSAGEKPYGVRFSHDKESSPWWAKDVEEVLRPEVRKMLEEYAGVPSERVVDHINQARDRSWEISPYASVGALTWLNAYISLHPAHATVLQKVKQGASILDCACSLAPDLRQLAYEGAPTDRMYGFDICPEFFDIAYDFYNDREKWEGSFFAANALEEFGTSRLGALEGKMDIIWCSKFLHLYNRAGQVDMAARLVKLLKPQAGSLFLGSQNGFPGSFEAPLSGSNIPGTTQSFLMADVDDIGGIWDEVAERTGTKWDFEARLLDLRTIGRHVDDGSQYKKSTGYNLQWKATLVQPAA